MSACTRFSQLSSFLRAFRQRHTMFRLGRACRESFSRLARHLGGKCVHLFVTFTFLFLFCTVGQSSLRTAESVVPGSISIPLTEERLSTVLNLFKSNVWCCTVKYGVRYTKNTTKHLWRPKYTRNRHTLIPHTTEYDLRWPKFGNLLFCLSCDKIKREWREEKEGKKVGLSKKGVEIKELTQK